MNTRSFEVRIWTTEKRAGARGTTYRVRWTVGGVRFGESFATAKLADSFRSTLLKAARHGESFDTSNGLPQSMAAAQPARTWLQVAREFIDEKWSSASPRHRKSTVEGLVTLTCGLTRESREPPDAKVLREALSAWEFNPTARRNAEAPTEAHQDALRWITEHTVPIEALASTSGVREAVRLIGLKLDGSRAAPATYTRKRAALSGVLNFAVEQGYLPHNPLIGLRMPAARAPSDSVDPRVLINPKQARDLLDAVLEVEPALHAFFAFLYYAGPRPAEVRNVRLDDIHLPSRGWGNVIWRGGYQESGRAWTDAGTRGEERELKHRAPNDTRSVPLHPRLVAALRNHVDDFGTGVGGRLFVTRTGRGGHPLAAPYQNPVSMSTVYRVLDLARSKAFAAKQYESPLARRPYDLRHACLTTWLNAGVDTTLVARWAGHSVTVLLKVYAGCLDDRDAIAKARIEEMLADDR